MGFENGWIALHQVLAQHRASPAHSTLKAEDTNSYPWRRDYIYAR